MKKAILLLASAAMFFCACNNDATADEKNQPILQLVILRLQ